MRSLGILATVSAATFYCTQYHPFDLKGETFKLMLNGIGRNKPQNQLWILKFMLKYKLLSNKSIDLSNMIIQQGFDINGRLLDGLNIIKVGGIQLGPISLKAAEKKQGKIGGEDHFGILYCKSMIRTFCDDKVHQILTTSQNDREQDKYIMKIGVNIEADEEVLEYTPYLYDQNITNSVKQLITYWPQYEVDYSHQINFITINASCLKQSLSSAGMQQQYGKLMKRTNQKVLKVVKQQVADSTINGFNKKVQLYIQEDTGKQRKSLVGSTQNTLEPYKIISWKELLEIIKQEK